MFNPLETFSGLLGALLDVVGTTITAFFLPSVSLILTPILSILTSFL